MDRQDHSSDLGNLLIGALVITGVESWMVRAGRFAERHGLIIIIALGEVIVAIGISVVRFC